MEFRADGPAPENANKYDFYEKQRMNDINNKNRNNTDSGSGNEPNMGTPPANVGTRNNPVQNRDLETGRGAQQSVAAESRDAEQQGQPDTPLVNSGEVGRKKKSSADNVAQANVQGHGTRAQANAQDHGTPNAAISFKEFTDCLLTEHPEWTRATGWTSGVVGCHLTQAMSAASAEEAMQAILHALETRGKWSHPVLEVMEMPAEWQPKLLPAAAYSAVPLMLPDGKTSKILFTNLAPDKAWADSRPLLSSCCEHGAKKLRDWTACMTCLHGQVDAVLIWAAGRATLASAEVWRARVTQQGVPSKDRAILERPWQGRCGPACSGPASCRAWTHEMLPCLAGPPANSTDWSSPSGDWPGPVAHWPGPLSKYHDAPKPIGEVVVLHVTERLLEGGPHEVDTEEDVIVAGFPLIRTDRWVGVRALRNANFTGWKQKAVVVAVHAPDWESAAALSMAVKRAGLEVEHTMVFCTDRGVECIPECVAVSGLAEWCSRWSNKAATRAREVDLGVVHAVLSAARRERWTPWLVPHKSSGRPLKTEHAVVTVVCARTTPNVRAVHTALFEMAERKDIGRANMVTSFASVPPETDLVVHLQIATGSLMGLVESSGSETRGAAKWTENTIQLVVTPDEEVDTDVLQRVAEHSVGRTTPIYDRRNDVVVAVERALMRLAYKEEAKRLASEMRKGQPNSRGSTVKGKEAEAAVSLQSGVHRDNDQRGKPVMGLGQGAGGVKQANKVEAPSRRDATTMLEEREDAVAEIRRRLDAQRAVEREREDATERLRETEAQRLSGVKLLQQAEDFSLNGNRGSGEEAGKKVDLWPQSGDAMDSSAAKRGGILKRKDGASVLRPLSGRVLPLPVMLTTRGAQENISREASSNSGWGEDGAHGEKRGGKDEEGAQRHGSWSFGTGQQGDSGGKESVALQFGAAPSEEVPVCYIAILLADRRVVDDAQFGVRDMHVLGYVGVDQKTTANQVCREIGQYPQVAVLSLNGHAAYTLDGNEKVWDHIRVLSFPFLAVVHAGVPVGERGLPEGYDRTTEIDEEEDIDREPEQQDHLYRSGCHDIQRQVHGNMLLRARRLRPPTQGRGAERVGTPGTSDWLRGRYLTAAAPTPMGEGVVARPTGAAGGMSKGTPGMPQTWNGGYVGATSGRAATGKANIEAIMAQAGLTLGERMIAVLQEPMAKDAFKMLRGHLKGLKFSKTPGDDGKKVIKGNDDLIRAKIEWLNEAPEFNDLPPELLMHGVATSMEGTQGTQALRNVLAAWMRLHERRTWSAFMLECHRCLYADGLDPARTALESQKQGDMPADRFYDRVRANFVALLSRQAGGGSKDRLDGDTEYQLILAIMTNLNDATYQIVMDNATMRLATDVRAGVLTFLEFWELMKGTFVSIPMLAELAAKRGIRASAPRTGHTQAVAWAQEEDEGECNHDGACACNEEGSADEAQEDGGIFVALEGSDDMTMDARYLPPAMTGIFVVKEGQFVAPEGVAGRAADARKCWSCGKTGHLSNACPTYDKSLPLAPPEARARLTRNGSTGQLAIQREGRIFGNQGVTEKGRLASGKTAPRGNLFGRGGVQSKK